MKEYYDRLNFLIGRMPDCNTDYNRVKMSNFLAEYEFILDTVNSTNAINRDNTNIFYSRINGIHRNLYEAKQAKTQKNKDLAFFNAVRDLQADLKTLAAIMNAIPD